MDYNCDECGKNIIIDAKICCHTPIDCGCGGHPQGEYLCVECEWKRDFDPYKLKVVISYDGEKLNEDQIQWVINEHSDLIEEIIH